jgi:pterin-4a-carbinolamine dehydratase
VEGKRASKTTQKYSFNKLTGWIIKKHKIKKEVRFINNQRTLEVSNENTPKNENNPIPGGSQTALLSANNNLI